MWKSMSMEPRKRKYLHGSQYKGIQDNTNALNRPPPACIHKTNNRLVSTENSMLTLDQQAEKRARKEETDHRA